MIVLNKTYQDQQTFHHTMSQKIIHTKKLDDITISFIDNSRPVAGDRWYIEIVCNATLPCTAELWTTVPDSDTMLLDCIQNAMGTHLLFSITRSRIFIADDTKDSIVNELIKQVDENILHYVNKQSFRNKLFEKKYQEARERCLTATTDKEISAEIQEEEEPVDFSHLFKPTG